MLMFRWLRLPILISVLVLAGAPAWGQCGCKDIPDLQLRREEVITAQLAFGSRVRLTEKTPYTVRDKNFLKDFVQAALNDLASRKGSTHATGETSNVGVMVIKAPTPCLHESIRQHELVHQQAALDDLQATAGGMWGDAEGDRFAWKKATLADYAREEIRGYAKEVEFIDKELKRLLKDCNKPPPLDRDYSSRSSSPGPDASNAPRPDPKPGSAAPVAKPKPMTTAPPMVKPKPLPKPPPIQ